MLSNAKCRWLRMTELSNWHALCQVLFLLKGLVVPDPSKFGLLHFARVEIAFRRIRLEAAT